MNNHNTTDDDIYKEELLNVGNLFKYKAKKVCRQKTILNKFPIIQWLPKYTLNDLIRDFVAGLTVGLTAIPQGIAYGVVAGLGPQYGLYSAFMGCFIYIFFGTCKDITVGPTAIMALMVQKYVTESPDYAILLCFLSGCIITIFGILKLGFLVQFISVPVTVGFTTAAAITIASGQINPLFGLKSPSNEFIEAWAHFFTHLNAIKIYDCILGIGTLIFLLGFRQLKNVTGKCKPIAKYSSLSRNALAVIMGILLAFLLNDYKLFTLTGTIQSGLPDFKIPPFTTTINGTTIEFSNMLQNLGSSIIAIPLIAILESIAIAKAFAKGKSIDASQEMIALGLCNIMGSFFQSMPVTGSFTRTAVNNASGVRTPLGGAVTGTLVILALALLTQTFYFIPKATLAAIIIAAMIFMVEYHKAIEIWKAKKIDVIPFLVTLITSLFLGLEYGMIIGIGVNVSFILYTSSRPILKLSKEKMNDFEYLIITLNDNLLFSSGEYVKYEIVKIVEQTKAKFVLINGLGINNIDSSAALNMLSLRNDLILINCDLIFWNWNVTCAGVLYRLNPLNKKYIKYSRNAEIAINEYLENKTELPV